MPGVCGCAFAKMPEGRATGVIGRNLGGNTWPSGVLMAEAQLDAEPTNCGEECEPRGDGAASAGDEAGAPPWLDEADATIATESGGDGNRR